MNFSLLAQTSKKILILTGILGIGTLSIAPAWANDHVEAMESTGEMETQMDESSAEAGNIVEIASGNKSFNTLVYLLHSLN